MNQAFDKLPQHEKKRKKPAALTPRSAEHLRKLGYICCNVEKWIPHTKQRKDAFGFGDLLAAAPAEAAGVLQGALLVQVCRNTDAAKRFHKIVTEFAENARRWLEAGNRIAVHGWAIKGGAGKRKTWQVRVVPVTLADLEKPDWCPV